MTSMLAGHGGAAFGKAEFNALPKDARRGRGLNLGLGPSAAINLRG